jgi:hypothetical protein
MSSLLDYSGNRLGKGWWRGGGPAATPTPTLASYYAEGYLRQIMQKRFCIDLLFPSCVSTYVTTCITASGS